MRRLWSATGAGMLLTAVGLAAPAGHAQADDRPTCLGDRAAIVGTAGDDVLRGTPGDDVIAARGGDDVVIGGGGSDVVCAARGADRVRDAWSVAAGPGDDVVRLAAEDDGSSAVGGAGDDLLVGSAGSDHLWGSSPGPGIGGSPVPRGRDDDRIVSGEGDDVITVTAGSEVVRTGAGQDMVEVADTTNDLDLDLGADADEAEISMAASADLSLDGGGGEAVDLLNLVLTAPSGVRPAGRLDLAASVFTSGGAPGAFSGWDVTTVFSAADWTIVGTDRQEDFLINGGSVHATLRGGTDNISVYNDGPRADYVDGGDGRDYADVGEDDGDVCVDVEVGDCAPQG